MTRARRVCRRVDGSGTFALRVWFPGGAVRESLPGQACLAGRSLAEGTLRRDWYRLAVDLEDQGMSVSTFGGLELFGLSLDGLAEDWEKGLEWAAEMLLEPSFDPERVEWLRQQTRAELDSLADQPEVVTAWAFLEQLYGTHPAGRPIQGVPESLERLTSETCRQHHARALEQGPVLALAGDVDPDAVLARFDDLFPGAGCASPIEVPAAEEQAPTRRDVPTTAPDQAQLYLGHLTVDRHHEDLAALELLAVILGAGSGLNGRIPQRVREDEGLAYTAQANTVSGTARVVGRLVAYVGTSPDSLERAEAVAREVLEDVATRGVTSDEVESARAYLLGREPFRMETSRQWADLLGQASYFDQPSDDPAWRRARLEGVTLDEVNAAAARHVRVDELVVARGLPAT